MLLARSNPRSTGLINVVAAIMHLGNLEFDPKNVDKASIKDSKPLDIAAGLIEVDPERLSLSMVSQKKKMGRDFITTFRTREQAEATRDACCKALYNQAFNWLIQRINKALAVKKNKNCHVVGVLDIFGFEIFETNRFEQFCINFANEKMQQHFNEHIFTMEQNEYKADKIDVSQVDFVDNQPCLDVIETGKGSILGMCDEELKVPKGSDDNLLNKLHTKYANNKYYIKPKMQKPQFGINHYAGEVVYQIGEFMIKNKDSLEVDVAEAITSSSSGFVAALIQEASKKTVGSQFREQLTSLMTALKKTDPHFIRCIKPNSLKARDTFDSQMSLRQLRYLGIKEVVNIRQLGYPIRRSHDEFWARYKLVAPEALRFNKKLSPDKAAQQLLEGMDGIKAADWRIGLSKVFYRNAVQTKLESVREGMITEMVVNLQAMARAKLWRARFQLYKGAKSELEKAIKGKSVEQLDKALEAFQSLGFSSDPKLIQKAVKAKNDMIKQAKALSALVNAMKSMDEQLIDAALKAAKKAKVDDTLKEYVEAKALHKKLKAYNAEAKQAEEAKDAKLIRAALKTAKALGFDGQREKDLAELLKAVEEGEKMKARLNDAMKSKDLNALKALLEMSMQSKSGAMMDNALKRAMAAGLADDPIVKAAMEMEKTLEKEVSVYNLAAELQNAINSRDLEIITATAKMAEDKNMTAHALYKQAKSLMATLKQEKNLTRSLEKAMDEKDADMLTATIQACEMSGMLQDSELMAEAIKMKKMLEGDDANKAAKEENKLDSAYKLLDSAMAAGNASMLTAAIERALAAGVNKKDPKLMQAQDVLDDAEREDDLMAQEEDQALAAVENEDGLKPQAVKKVKRNLVNGAAVPEVQFDEAEYTQDQYKLARFRNLRTGQDFAAKSVLKKKKVMANMLYHSKSALPRSLTSLDASLDAMAVELFKSVQGFMGDRTLQFPDTLASEVVEAAAYNRDLRDELFCQLIKQLTRNQDKNTCSRGWQLMCLITEVLVPSDALMIHLLYFIHSNKDGDYAAYAVYALRMLSRTAARFEEGDIADAPKDKRPKVVLEIERVTAFKSRVLEAKDVTITFPDASAMTFRVEPWDFCEMLVKTVANTLNMTDFSDCAFFELRGTEEIYLFPYECVSDTVRGWAQQADTKRKTNKGKFSLFKRKAAVVVEEDSTRKIIFKRRIHGKPIGESICVVNTRLMFHQCQRDVVGGSHNVNQESAVNLAATFKVAVESGSIPKLGQEVQKEDNDSYTPVCMWNAPMNLKLGKKNLTDKKFAGKLEKALTEPQFQSVDMETYMAMVRQLPSFGACFYKMSQTYDKSYPARVMLAINIYGVSIIDLETWKEVSFYPLMAVLGWSHTPQQLLLKLKLEKPVAGKTSSVLRLGNSHPKQGKEVCDLLLSYANEMMRAFAAAKAKGPPPAGPAKA